MLDDFLPLALARKLRCEFDARVSGSGPLQPEAFCWQMWHAPGGQYVASRTPAGEFFSPAAWRALVSALQAHGLAELGCGDLAPGPWLSVYTTGCGQQLHADVPHGPWAWVLSLTQDEDAARFRGGETLVLRPAVLDYWRRFDVSAVVELPQLAELVAPAFNRLTLFDARIPHGVTPVSGAPDPARARVVLHGWFTHPPGPAYEGDALLVQPQPQQPAEATPVERRRAGRVRRAAVPAAAAPRPEVESALGACVSACSAELALLPPLLGLLSLRLEVALDGAVARIAVLADTLVARPGAGDGVDDPDEARAMVLRCVAAHLGALRLPTGPGAVTLPLLFE